jgi:putative tricarboxylic transport membrane protein
MQRTIRDRAVRTARDTEKGKLSMRSRIAVIALAVVAAGMAQGAVAQDYPNRPITVIVPFAAGGPTDVVTRIIGDQMQRTLGQQFVVENVGGAGGTTGMTRAAQATPDGYTIAIGNTGTQAASGAVYNNVKYDPITSFQQIGILNFTPQAIVAKATTEAKDLKSFIAYLQANSQKLSYGHAGVGSTSHVSGVVFNSKFGLNPGLVAYRGTGPALNDLVGGQIDYMVDQSLNVIPQIKGGTIKAYAIAATERLESLPDVPTTKEQGVDFVFTAWNVMVAPKGVPKEVVDKLVAALNKALDEPAVKARYVELGSTAPKADERGPAPLEKLVSEEVARITPLLKAALAKAADAEKAAPEKK